VLKTSPVVPADLRKSVIAVPPLARSRDRTVSRPENAKLIRYLEERGVTTLMYGGNANFYNIGLTEYAGVLDLLIETASKDTFIIPSAGPDFGKMMDQAAILKERGFPTAMVLPATAACTPDGVEAGLRLFAEALGKPLVIYIKTESYLTPAHCKRLADDGLVCGIKYAVVRQDPAQDAFLSRLVDMVDRSLIISGIGERPAITHLTHFSLVGMTSGSVCVAPNGSRLLFEALKAGHYREAERLRAMYIPLEDLRDAISPVQVLHEAVTLASIADMGPLLPLFGNLNTEHHAAVGEAARRLAAADFEQAERAA
jgi:dihydrodipicolinate synthase/N-acetylneuraminate lyase